MLDITKLLKLIKSQQNSLFFDNSKEITVALEAWQKLSNDDLLSTKLQQESFNIPIAQWTEKIDNRYKSAQIKDYSVVATDGSQIYPDRHQGISCFLINIGFAAFQYCGKSQVNLYNSPFLYENELNNIKESDVNCIRQELEFKCALDLSQTKSFDLYLFDGSLIFSHLNPDDEYFGKYLGLLYQFYKQSINIASFISLPKNKDLINLIKAYLVINKQSFDLKHLFDSDIVSTYLNQNERTVLFKSSNFLTQHYPDVIKPYFYYLKVNEEIVRVEIPFYITQDKTRIEKINSIIVDQCSKGFGYPISIAEAHEQAVIKSIDRDFFYKMIYKAADETKNKIFLSRKSIKKKNMPI